MGPWDQLPILGTPALQLIQRTVAVPSRLKYQVLAGDPDVHTADDRSSANAQFEWQVAGATCGCPLAFA